jgi:hypothetical protein
MNKYFCPKARKHELVTTKISDETVVYDLKTDKGSCLVALTTIVWEACDGHRATPRYNKVLGLSGRKHRFSMASH